MTDIVLKMAETWPKRFGVANRTENIDPDGTNLHRHCRDDDNDDDNNNDDEFDHARKGRLKAATQGWEGELKRYVEEPLCDVKKNMDTLKWWSVSVISTSGGRVLIGYVVDAYNEVSDSCPLSTRHLAHPRIICFL